MPIASSEKRYPIGDDPKYHEILTEADKQAELETQAFKGMGPCHFFWKEKKRILKEKGIDGKSPEELYPHSDFD